VSVSRRGGRIAGVLLFGTSLVVIIPLLACIPFPRTALVRPEGDLRVIDDATGQPILGAVVRVHRIRHPHSRVSGRWEQRTNGRGEVAFTMREESETVYPLCLHGVPGYEWAACAEARDHAPRTIRWDPPESGRHHGITTIRLAAGSGPCDRALRPPP
jgi:hypothetical protein